jgi:hypothetical protein
MSVLLQQLTLVVGTGYGSRLAAIDIVDTSHIV